MRRALLAIAAAATVVAAVGTVTSYLEARPLLHGDTRPVTGVVVNERDGYRGIWNVVTVLYPVGTQAQAGREIDIPVRGAGFTFGRGIEPHYYERGEPIELLVSTTDDTRVRTTDRWSPKLYNWIPVLFVALGSLGALALVERVERRKRD